MKILLCAYHYMPPEMSSSLAAGTSSTLADLARGLAQRHEIMVLTSKKDSTQPSFSGEEGVSVYRVPTLFRGSSTAAYWLAMAAFLPGGIQRGSALARERQFDVVSTHGLLPAGLVGQAVARLYGLPHILSLADHDLCTAGIARSPYCHSATKAAARYLLTGADVLVTHNEGTLRHMRTLYGINRSVETVLDNDGTCVAQYEEIFKRAIDPTEQLGDGRHTLEQKRTSLKNVVNS